MKTDIRDIEDIKLLVDTFYTKVRENPVIGFIFNDVAKVDWEEHLPKMYSFWNSVLFGQAMYKGNPMLTHVLLSRKTPMEASHFEEWKRLFYATVDELFEGDIAEAAKYKANSIASLMLYKIQQNANPLHIQ